MLEDLYAHVAGDAGVLALLGADSAGACKLYAPPVPGGLAVPYGVIQRISSTYGHSYTRGLDLASTIVQLDAYAATPSAAEAIAEAYRACLDGLSGTVGSTTFHGVFLEGLTDGVEYDGDGAATGTSRVIATFEVLHAVTPASPSA